MPRVALLLVLTLTLFGQKPATPPAPSSPTAPALPAWMEGKWTFFDRGWNIEETWTSAEGDMMFGMGRTYAPYKVLTFEYLRIVQRGKDLIYIAQPDGDPPTEFKLVSADKDSVVFANPAHDFPKQITYRREGAGRMVARVEGAGGRARIFNYKRVK